jgi:WD40 repeat protein
MQKIFCVKYSGDAHYVFSGSDDTNIRIWKSDASRQLGIVSVVRLPMASNCTESYFS